MQDVGGALDLGLPDGWTWDCGLGPFDAQDNEIQGVLEPSERPPLWTAQGSPPQPPTPEGCRLGTPNSGLRDGSDGSLGLGLSLWGGLRDGGTGSLG